MADVVAAFAVVFLAELGDKTQLVALTLAGRHPATRVLLALTGAIVVLQTLSVTAGALVAEAVPDRAIAVAAGLLFLGFAVWTWRSGDDAEDDGAGAGGLLGAAVAFFLAELGDKTMLATITLATDHGWLGTWIGSTLGMVAADALAIVVGRALGKRLPERTIAIGAAILFFAFGIWLGIEAIAELT